MDFDEALETVEPQLRKTLEDLEGIGLYFNVDAEPLILNPSTGLLESLWRTEATIPVLESAREWLLPLVIMAKDMAEHLQMDSENLTFPEMDKLMAKAVRRLRGEEIPL